jgi:hypothetical protein
MIALAVMRQEEEEEEEQSNIDKVQSETQSIHRTE